MKMVIIPLIALIFGLSSCSHLEMAQRLENLEKELDNLKYQEMAERVGASYGQVFAAQAVATGDAKSMDAINHTTYSLATGDICIVVDSSGDMATYRYDATSSTSQSLPWIVQPDSNTGNGRWIMIRGIQLKNDGSEASSITMYENYSNGTDYYKITAPSSITTSREFNIDSWDTLAYSTNANKTVRIDESKTIFQLNISGFTANRTFTLPEASTCPGAEYVFFIQTGHASYFANITPASGDRIIGTSTAGYYVQSRTALSVLHIRQVGNDHWMIVNMVDSTTPTLPSGWVRQG